MSLRRDMRQDLVLAFGLVYLCAGISTAEEVLAEISWDRLAAQGRLESGNVLPPDDQSSFERLTLQNLASKATTWRVLTLENPGIRESRYAIQGRVRYRGVEGQGFLEMWSKFRDGGAYFSRTLSSSGPMRSLSGTSNWRDFTLPFYITEGNERPVQLVLNVVLPDKGTVELGMVRLLQYGPTEDPLAQEGVWWGEAAGGLIGGIAGSMLGCLGGLLGWLASKGRARGFVLGGLKALLLGGVVVLAWGLVAVFRSQPYAVYYPLLLLGLTATIAAAWSLPRVKKRYEELRF